MNLLAELVDAAVAEHRPAQQRLRLADVIASAERVRLDAFVPVAADVGDVTVLGGGHQERESPGVARVPDLRLRGDGDAVIVGAAGPRRAVVQPDDRYVGARHRRPGVETRDEDQRVLRAVLHGDAEVGHLHHRRVDRGRHDERTRSRDRLPLLHGRPHQARAARLQHA